MPEETLREVLQRHAPRLLALPGVVGVAEGESDGRACIAVYVAERTAAVLAQVPSDLEGWPVVVRAGGELRALGDERSPGRVSENASPGGDQLEEER